MPFRGLVDYEDDQEYEECRDARDEACRDDRVDRLYDEMRDDFLCIDNEEDAKSCIHRYPRQVDRFLPDRWKYILKDETNE